MENNTLGRILRENREKQKLSKQKVCRGLCTVMALSRYESDERIPDKFLMDALLNGLGFSCLNMNLLHLIRNLNIV